MVVLDGRARPTPLKTVMLVEDDSLLREVIAMALEDRGVNLLVAENGEEALRQLRDAQPLPTLIFLDLLMPVMDGRQFREAQLGDPALAAIPVILLSAHGDASEAAREMGVTTWLKKPLDLRVILKAVEDYA